LIEKEKKIAQIFSGHKLDKKLFKNSISIKEEKKDFKQKFLNKNGLQISKFISISTNFQLIQNYAQGKKI
jgi:hypothetical protein